MLLPVSAVAIAWVPAGPNALLLIKIAVMNKGKEIKSKTDSYQTMAMYFKNERQKERCHGYVANQRRCYRLSARGADCIAPDYNCNYK